ncbi:sorbosone dehydrogenase family protein [Actinomadura sp. NEAU-AAG7]|uniref:PQQ-dependent sugar dehydrogenase n=1 Tax=Actinomadura sp. NEAU-AAG7 TaxID=2839640 RepID=UPI001BE43FD3|nr:PQQ-dependent sugar dehydrogenase [Actinomadura sp. NEAU-AAG7]MBT2213616.1 PQQ-dependent sugar dehydrogenase [Actinomadura sp. NEAU-AAG7]
MRRHAITLTSALVAACTALLAGCSSSDGGKPEGGPGTPAPASTAAPTATAGTGAARVLVTGLSVPWGVAFLPGGDALVTERDSARLLRVTPAGKRTVVGTVPDVRPSGEGGLLGVAVSPGYARDHQIFLYHTAADDNRVVRATYDGRLDTPRPIVTGIPKGDNHNGGRLAFGPDGMLYATTGESGAPEKSQERGSLGGKILRVTPDGRPAPGNPFGTPVWTYGHRNVQGIAWDEKQRLYATEFGQVRFDEINRIVKGDNYGWPTVEGIGHRRGFTDPLVTWPTDQASPSGLAYANGSLWAAALQGTRLWQVPLRDGVPGRPVPRYQDAYGRLRAVVRAPSGDLWVTTSNKDGRGDPKPDDDRVIVLPAR